MEKLNDQIHENYKSNLCVIMKLTKIHGLIQIFHWWLLCLGQIMTRKKRNILLLLTNMQHISC